MTWFKDNPIFLTSSVLLVVLIAGALALSEIASGPPGPEAPLTSSSAASNEPAASSSAPALTPSSVAPASPQSPSTSQPSVPRIRYYEDDD